MKEQKIHIVLAPDENYVVPAGMVMLSALKTASRPQNFIFYFLGEEGCLQETSKKKLRKIATGYQASIQFVSLNADLLKHLPTNNHLTISTYYRMLVSTILPNIDKCIYLDCDVMVLDDLEKLWKEDVSSAALGVVNDWLNEKLNRRKFSQIRHYFNAGILYINLRRWREKGYQDECIRRAQEEPALCERFADQDLLNVIFCEDRIMLHQRWNIQGSMNAESCWHLRNEKDVSMWNELKRNPGVAHFIGKQKPWHFYFESDWAITYWNVLARSPWADEYKKDIWKARKIWFGYKVRISKIKTQLFLRSLEQNVRMKRKQFINHIRNK
jgi:lipopolysaccharide biosynthesis glycosyltransferase